MKHIIIAISLFVITIIGAGAAPKAVVTCAPRTVNTLHAGAAIRQMQYEGCTRFHAEDNDSSQDPSLTVLIWGSN